MAPPLTPAETQALVRFRQGSGSPHVESYVLKLNPAPGRALWLKLSWLRRAVGKRDAVVEAWALAWDLAAAGGAGPVALKSTWPAADARLDPDCFFVQVGTVEWAHGRTRGELTEGDQRIGWQLTFTTGGEGYRPPSPWRAHARALATTCPELDARCDGVVTIGDHAHQVSGAPALFGHDWGRSHAEAWTRVHCNRWDTPEEPLLVEGLAVDGGLGPLPLPLHTRLHVRLGGERLSARGRFAARSLRDGLAWHFAGRAGDRRFTGRFYAPAERFVGLNLPDTDGRLVHTVQTLTADGELKVERRGRGGEWLPALSARTRGAAALEHGARTRDPHGVPVLLIRSEATR